jgi:hypothetical protein
VRRHSTKLRRRTAVMKLFSASGGGVPQRLAALRSSKPTVRPGKPAASK